MASPTPRISPPTTWHRPHADWLREFRERGAAAHARKQEPRRDITVQHAIPKALNDLLATDSSAVPALARKGIDGDFAAAGLDLQTELDAATALPTGAAGRELLTPDQRRLCELGASLYRDGLRSARDAGKSLNAAPSDLSAFGSVTDFDLDTPEGVRDALKQFLDAAPTRSIILEEAGYGADELREVAKTRENLTGVLESKQHRATSLRNRTAAIAVAQLALDAWEATYRARARTALQRQPDLLSVALGILPRQTQHRRTRLVVPPKPRVLPVDADKPDKGDEGADKGGDT